MTVPITLVSGFLGSGKTTLINQAIKDSGVNRDELIIIENEVGEINVDHHLILESAETIYELNQGCICCNLRSDLLMILHQIKEMYGEGMDPKHIIIETTGIADPRPIIQTIDLLSQQNGFYYLDAIYGVFDCKNYQTYLKDSEEAVSQLAFADRIYLSKLEEVERKTIEARIRSINPFAEIHDFKLDDPSLAQSFFDQHLYQSTEGIEIQMEPATDQQKDQDHEHGDHETCDHHDHDHHEHDGHHHGHSHEHGVQTLYLKTDVPLVRSYFQNFMDGLLLTQQDHLYRYKGFVKLEDSPDFHFLVQGVSMDFNCDSIPHVPGKSTELVLIGKGMNETLIKHAFDDLITHTRELMQERHA